MTTEWTMSPTPWSAVEVATNAIAILDADGRRICTVTAVDDADELSDVDRGNAGAIVRYVNTCADDDDE